MLFQLPLRLQTNPNEVLLGKSRKFYEGQKMRNRSWDSQIFQKVANCFLRLPEGYQQNLLCFRVVNCTWLVKAKKAETGSQESIFRLFAVEKNGGFIKKSRSHACFPNDLRLRNEWAIRRDKTDLPQKNWCCWCAYVPRRSFPRGESLMAGSVKARRISKMNLWILLKLQIISECGKETRLPTFDRFSFTLRLT